MSPTNGFLFGLALWLALCALAWSASPSQYTLTDLGEQALPSAIDTHGTVVGSVPRIGTEQTEREAAILAPLPRQFLGTFRPGGVSVATDIAGARIVGWSSLTDNPFRGESAFIWTAAGGLHNLGAPSRVGANPFSHALAVSTGGLIVGTGDTAHGSAPLVWRGDMLEELPTLGGSGGTANAVSADGDIVGASSTADGRTHATLWASAGGIVDLDTLGSPASSASGINSLREVVGTVNPRTPAARPFHWTAQTGMQLLPLLPGDTTGEAVDISEAGVIIGTSGASIVRWDSGQPIALQPLVTKSQGWGLDVVAAVNDTGQLVGSGTFNGHRHGFLLTPVAPTPPVIPTLMVWMAGDFDGDGLTDWAGLDRQHHIWQWLGVRQTWAQLPGQLETLVVGDLDGDGKDDLAGINSQGIWVMTNGRTWGWIPGHLDTLITGDFYGDGKQHLAGLDRGWIWRSPRLGVWEWVPGHLDTLIAGDFWGVGVDVFAGLERGYIWVQSSTAYWQWTWIPGQLRTLHAEAVVGQDDLVGWNGLGCYRMHTLYQWTLEPCGPLTLAGQ